MGESWNLDEAALVAWGESIGRSIRAPLVIALRGDLGAGKTTLARAIARGAGVPGPIPSPTYNLLFRYPADRGIDLVHIDLYRIEDEEEVWILGWSDLPAENEVVLIEWPERVEGLVPEPRWEVGLEEASDPGKRLVTVEVVGNPHSISLPGGVDAIG